MYRFAQREQGWNSTLIDKEQQKQLDESTKHLEKAIIYESRYYGNDTSRIVIGGFCQGGCVAYNTFMKTKHKIAGVVAMASWVPPYAKKIPEDKKKIPILA
jgi:phospholipase/carboxylesterase